jgi:hypothetical protein
MTQNWNLKYSFSLLFNGCFFLDQFQMAEQGDAPPKFIP